MARISSAQEVCMGNPGSEIWLEEDGIVRIRYPENVHLTLDVMESVYQRHIEITTDKRPILAYAETVASVDYDAQQFVSADKPAALTSALAIIVKSAFTRAIGEMFMMFHRPPYPTRMFPNEEEAIEWLKTFLTDEAKVSAKHPHKS